MSHKEQNRNCPKRTSQGPSRPGIHREHHGGNGCTGQQQCHWLPPLWVNFITTSRRSPEPWKWWLGFGISSPFMGTIQVSEILFHLPRPLWNLGKYAGNIIQHVRTMNGVSSLHHVGYYSCMGWSKQHHLGNVPTLLHVLAVAIWEYYGNKISISYQGNELDTSQSMGSPFHQPFQGYHHGS